MTAAPVRARVAAAAKGGGPSSPEHDSGGRMRLFHSLPALGALVVVPTRHGAKALNARPATPLVSTREKRQQQLELFAHDATSPVRPGVSEFRFKADLQAGWDARCVAKGVCRALSCSVRRLDVNGLVPQQRTNNGHPPGVVSLFRCVQLGDCMRKSRLLLSVDGVVYAQISSVEKS